MKKKSLIRHMSKDKQTELKQIVDKVHIPIKMLQIEINCQSLIHFAEIAIYNVSDPKNPVVTISIDRPNDSSKSYFVDGVHFYMDFSKVTIKLLLPIQKLVYLINKDMK